MSKEDLLRELMRRYDLSPSEIGLGLNDMVAQSIAFIPKDSKYTSVSSSGVMEGRTEYTYVALEERDRTIRTLAIYPSEECYILNVEARTDVDSELSLDKQLEAGTCRVKMEIKFLRPLKPGDETRVRIFYLIKDSILSRHDEFLARLPKTPKGPASFQSVTSTVRVPLFRNYLEVEYFGYRVKSFELVRALELDEIGFPKRYEGVTGSVTRKHEGGIIASFTPPVNSVTGVLYYLEKP